MARRVATLCVAVILCGAACCAGQGDPVVARGKGIEVRRSEVLRRVLDDFGRDVVEEIILSLLLAHRAKEAGIKIDPQRVTAVLQDIEQSLPRNRDGTPAITLEEYLAQRGLTVGVALRRIRDKLIADALIEREIKISDEAVRARFEKQRELLKRPERREIVYVACDSKAQAQQAIAALRAGREVPGAKRVIVVLRENAGPVVRAVFSWKPPSPERPFERVCQEPIEHEGKFYAVRLDAVYPAETEPRLEDHYAEIKLQLLHEERDRRRAEWLRKLREQAQVKILFAF